MRKLTLHFGVEIVGGNVICVTPAAVRIYEVPLCDHHLEALAFAVEDAVQALLDDGLLDKKTAAIKGYTDGK